MGESRGVPAESSSSSAQLIDEAGPTRHYGQIVALIASQLLAGIGVASGVAVGGLLAEDLTGVTSMAGLAQTASVLGAGVWAIPLARLAHRRGRRWGLGVGYLLAGLGASGIIGASMLGWVPLLFVGFALFGAGTAAGLQARFAATEVVSTAYRARAMSLVLWATTLGSIAGPNLSQLGADLGARFGIEPLAGPYLFSLMGFAAALLVIGLALHPPAGAEAGTTTQTGLLESLRMIGRSRVTLLAVVTLAVSHTVMVGVMVMTPVHMNHHGLALNLVGLAISIHIFGMYGASPIFGWLADKINPHGVIGIGVVIFAVALVLAGLSSTPSFAMISVALGLLGLGWSAGMIGGSALLAASVTGPEKASVQGATDAVMNVSAACSSALSGIALGLIGYPGLAVIAGAVLLPLIILLARTRNDPAVLR